LLARVAIVFFLLASFGLSPASAQKEKKDESTLDPCIAKFEEVKKAYEAAATKGPEVRFPLLFEFGEAPCDVTVQYLEGILQKEKDAGILMSIAQVLGRIGSKRSIEVLFTKAAPLIHEDAFTRQAIGEAFDRRIEPAAEEWFVDNFRRIKLIESLRSDTPLWTRIVKGLVNFRTDKRHRILIDELRRPGSPEIKVALLGALEDVKNSQVLTQAKALVRANEPEVQAAALMCLFRQDPKRNIGQFTSGLKSKHWQVRLVSLRILSELEHKGIVEEAAKALVEDPNEKVKLTAVRTLLRAGGKPSVEALIQGMAKAEGRLADDIADALARLTGRNLGTFSVQWESWWIQNRDKDAEYKALSLAEYAKILEKEQEQQTLLYHGLRVIANAVFVIDTSESMTERYEPKTEEKGRTVVESAGGTLKTRMEVAKEELTNVLKSLQEGKVFDIVGFDSVIRDFIPDALGKEPEKLEPMTPTIRASAQQFVVSLSPAGATYILSALRQAFSYEDVEAIYLLSDGAPTPSSGTPEEILAWLRQENRLRNVRINTIAFGLEEEDKAFLIQLAEENFGVFVER